MSGLLHADWRVWTPPARASWDVFRKIDDRMHDAHWINWTLNLKVIAVSDFALDFLPHLHNRGFSKDARWAFAKLVWPPHEATWHGPFKSRQWAMACAETEAALSGWYAVK